MKELITQALNEAFILLEKRTPQTKIKIESISIVDVKPIELVSFMQQNNIPDNATFDGKDNGYDAWDDILLSWEVFVPTTENDKLKFKKEKFTYIAFSVVRDLLKANNYKIVGQTQLHKKFDNETLYDMYLEKDFDRITKLYSLSFSKQ